MSRHTHHFFFFLVPIVFFLFSSCNTSYEISPDAYYPLKIGVLVLNDTAADANECTLQYIQPGETLVMRCSGSFNGQDTVNLNLEFTVHDGYCIVTSEDEDIQICRVEGAVPFYHAYFGDWGKMLFDFTGNVYESGWLAIAPLGAKTHHVTVWDGEMQSTINRLSHVPPAEHEYWLTAKAYDSDGKRIVTAKMKILNLPVKDSDKKSRDYSIELVEYTLSDNYMMFLQ